MLQATSFHDSVRERMAIYRKAAGDQPIKAYINIGGATLSVGRSLGKKLYPPGLNLEASPAALNINCVMTQFMKQHVPVIHLVQIYELAKQHGLPIKPQTAQSIGSGQLYIHRSYKRPLAGGVLLVLFIGLWVFILRKVPRGLATSPVPANGAEPHRLFRDSPEAPA